MNQGSFGGRSGGRSVVFSALVFICVLCLFLFLSSSLSFSQTVTSSLFIVSFVHSVVLLLKSDHCGRMIVCNAKQCWQKSSLQCEGWVLSCLLCWYFVSFKRRQSPCVLMDCCDPACCDPVVATFPQAVCPHSRKLL